MRSRAASPYPVTELTIPLSKKADDLGSSSGGRGARPKRPIGGPFASLGATEESSSEDDASTVGSDPESAFRQVALDWDRYCLHYRCSGELLWPGSHERAGQVAGVWGLSWRRIRVGVELERMREQEAE
ncbi:hypothetical protein B5X24_HaOG210741 [Helicoverpa armigera]|uniref:Uncharacterized protein n=1 Tax=Helicoverpa armigera TaxID=29058 RepID=A0A2W1BG22_HELAM|nr:hypothetical protein B5X24_HaOG210741 [Helicoverpa armigera]